MFCEVRVTPKFINSYNFRIIIILDYFYSDSIHQAETFNEKINKKRR